MKNISIQTDSLDFTKPIKFYANLYGLSLNAIRNRFKKLGVYNNFLFTKDNVSTILSNTSKIEYDINPKTCLQCKTIISYNKRKQTYCSNKCAAIHLQKDGGHCHWSDDDKLRLSILAKKNNSINSIQKNIPPKIKKKCLNCNKEFSVSNSYRNRKCCSKNCYNIWCKNSGYMKGKCGGLRPNSGKGKHGKYCGYYYQSSWELAWIIYQLDHNISFKRNLTGFEYTLNGETHKFYPDFILENGDYIEIKGWDNGQTAAKISQFPHKLIVLYKKDIQPYIEYMKEKCKTI